MHRVRKFAKFLSPHWTAPGVHRCNSCLARQFRRLWRHFPEGRNRRLSTMCHLYVLPRDLSENLEPSVWGKLTQRGGLGTVACLAGSPGCGGSPTQCATAVESSSGVNGGRLSRPCAGTSSTVDLSEQQRTNSNQWDRKDLGKEKRREKKEIWQLRRERTLMWQQWSGMTSSTTRSSRTGGQTSTSPWPLGTKRSTGKSQVSKKLDATLGFFLVRLCCLLARIQMGQPPINRRFVGTWILLQCSSKESDL